MKKLVIFDLDGTLVDTISDLANACNYALSTMGFPTHHLSVYPFYVGNGVSKLIERSLPTDSRDKETIRNVRQKFTEYYDEHTIDLSHPYEGIPELVKRLNDHGIKMAVASNKYQRAVEKIIYGLFPDIPWVAVEGQKTDVPVKPDPSVVFEILSKSPTPKQDVIFVGDSGVDIETARRACVESVGVTWGFRPESELVEHHANFIINKPLELMTLLNH